jgi:hypothetical protein
VLRAREVLSDCELALRDFEAAAPTAYWRTRWTALIALLRAVGHVLDKIDGARSAELKEAIAEAWAEVGQVPRTLDNRGVDALAGERTGKISGMVR